MNENDRAIVGLVTIAHAMVHTYEMSIPILVTIWLVEFGVTEAVLGLIVTVGYGLFGVGALPGGMFADRFGAQRLIVVCLAGMAGSFVLLGIAGGIALGDSTAVAGIPTSVVLIALSLLFWGVAASVYHPSGLSLISTGVESLAEFVAGSRRLFAGAFVAIFGIVMLSGLYYRGVLTFLPEILADFPVFQSFELGDEEFEAARYAYVGILMIGVVGQYAGGRLTDMIRPEVGLAISFTVLAMLAVAFLPASEAGTAPLLAVAGLLGIFLFVVQPMYQAAVADYTPAGTRGLSYGYTYLGVFGIGAAGGAIAGGLLTYANVAVLFGVLAGFALLAAAIGAAVALGVFTRFG